MSITYFVLFLSSFSAHGFLRTKPASMKGVQCPEKVNQTMWGMWVDGRDAQKGEHGYGKHYAQTIIPTLQHAYDRADQAGIIDSKFFVSSIKNKLGAVWRAYSNPVHAEVKKCHHEVPALKVKDIMSTVSVMDAKQYCPSRPLSSQEYKTELTSLFDKYGEEVKANPGRARELAAVAKLMQNVAYLHPFADQNGRSRMIMLNYILRQRGLACGTMMHNNNKNIYFETVPDIVASIEEGIEKYDHAAAAGFKENPWVSEAEQTTHFARFHKEEWKTNVEQCWNRSIGPGARGTSPTLVVKESELLDDDKCKN